jgi:hypothetical protein
MEEAEIEAAQDEEGLVAVYAESGDQEEGTEVILNMEGWIVQL